MKHVQTVLFSFFLTMWHQALSDHKDLLYIKDIDLEVLAFSELRNQKSIYHKKLHQRYITGSFISVLLYNNTLPHFVIPITLYNKFCLIFIIPVRFWNNLWHFVILWNLWIVLFVTLCNIFFRKGQKRVCEAFLPHFIIKTVIEKN